MELLFLRMCEEPNSVTPARPHRASWGLKIYTSASAQAKAFLASCRLRSQHLDLAVSASAGDGEPAGRRWKTQVWEPYASVSSGGPSPLSAPCAGLRVELRVTPLQCLRQCLGSAAPRPEVEVCSAGSEAEPPSRSSPSRKAEEKLFCLSEAAILDLDFLPFSSAWSTEIVLCHEQWSDPSMQTEVTVCTRPGQRPSRARSPAFRK